MTCSGSSERNRAANAGRGARELTARALLQWLATAALMMDTAPPRKQISSTAAWESPERATGEVLLHTVQIRSISDSYAAVALAKRAAVTIGLDTKGKGSAAIAAGELATNIARHAQEGTVRLYGGADYLKIVAQDRGPGIQNIESALADGHSKGRRIGPDDRNREGLGCGLGAVRRLMDRLQVKSEPGVGTCVVAVRFMTRSARV